MSGRVEELEFFEVKELRSRRAVDMRRRATVELEN
jgi:hypothetical protein